VEQIDQLAKNGTQEVVLTGIHIGTWGRDFSPPLSFTNLARALDEAPHNLWIRISSLDSPEIPDELIELMKRSKKIVPHLHIPLQSGHNQTLRRMGRGYTVEQFGERVLKLKEVLPHLCIGADVIVGFPGESEEEFAGTCAFLNRTPMDYLHVFPYSNRSGTRASTMNDQINGRIIKNRARQLREFSAERLNMHQQRHHATRRNAILIPVRKDEVPFRALTDNYIECTLDPESFASFCLTHDPPRAGTRIEVEIEARNHVPPLAKNLRRWHHD
jgi:threonylcarbamoyladenosine tRNA methylthiotransferase MtaB